LAGSAKGQFLIFTAPGGPEGRPETVKDRLDREIGEAPYRLGPIYVTPLAGFRDVAYVRDFFSSGQSLPADVTATVGAGFRAYLHTGRKVTWVAQALPEYVWWQKRTDARRLNLSGGVESILLLNRLTVDMAVSRLEQQRIATPEVPVLVSTATDLARLDAELELRTKLRPFVSARWSSQDGLVEDRDSPEIQRLDVLDRSEQVVRAGLHWYPRDDWMIGAGVERSRTDFDRTTLDSSNEGTSPAVEVRINRPHILFTADLAARSLQATEGSRFVDYDGLTGNLAVSLVPRRSLELWAYGNRDLVYSLAPNYPYLQDQRIGVAIGVGAGPGGRIAGRIFAETGTEEYTAFSPASPERSDDLVAYGGSLRFLLGRGLSLTFQATRIELDSNLPGSDRSYTSGGLSLALGGNLARRNL